MSDFLIGAHPASRFVGIRCPRRGPDVIYAPACPWCAADRLAAHIRKTQEDEAKMDHEWAP
jgi:hypothetical protein